MNRRNSIKTISLATGALLLPGQASPKPIATHRDEKVFSEVDEIAPDVFFAKGNITYFKSGNLQDIKCNNGWIVFDDFVLLIDANFPGNAPLLLDEIKKRTSKPVRFVFNTHHHGDHLYGNRFWLQHGAIPIAYTGLVQELRKYETGYFGTSPGRWEQMVSKRADLKTSSLCPPVQTFQDKVILSDKRQHVELIHLGRGHTSGDAVAWLPKHKIMFVGDSCLNGPYNLFRDAHVQSWINTLDIMAMYEPQIIIGGHGEAGDKNTITNQQTYFKKLLAWVTTQSRNETDWKVIEERIPLLREELASDSRARKYLINDPSVVDGFSLQAHAKKTFEELLIAK